MGIDNIAGNHLISTDTAIVRSGSKWSDLNWCERFIRVLWVPIKAHRETSGKCEFKLPISWIVISHLFWRSFAYPCGPGKPFWGHPSGRPSMSRSVYSCSMPNHGSSPATFCDTSLHPFRWFVPKAVPSCLYVSHLESISKEISKLMRHACWLSRKCYSVCHFQLELPISFYYDNRDLRNKFIMWQLTWQGCGFHLGMDLCRWRLGASRHPSFRRALGRSMNRRNSKPADLK